MLLEGRGGPESHGRIRATTGHEAAILRESDPGDRAHVPLQAKGQLPGVAVTTIALSVPS